MAIVVRNEGAKVNSNINVTPMVDVMLVLLIVFMVITPMLQNKVNVELAKVTDPTSMPDVDKEDSVVIAVTRDNRVYLGQNQVSMADLGGKVADLLTNKTDKQIFMRADARSQYGTRHGCDRRRPHCRRRPGWSVDRSPYRYHRSRTPHRTVERSHIYGRNQFRLAKPGKMRDKTWHSIQVVVAA